MTRRMSPLQRRIAHGPATWAALISLGAVLEAVALKGARREHTLSHATRVAFHTTTPAGKVSFVAGWIALTAWFLPHIINGPGEGE